MPYCSPHGFFPLQIIHSELSILNYPNERQVVHNIFRPNKRTRTSVNWVKWRQSQVWASLNHLTSQYEAALGAEAGKCHLFGLARVCRAAENKKRQLRKLHKVVLTCGPDGIRTRDIYKENGLVDGIG